MVRTTLLAATLGAALAQLIPLVDVDAGGIPITATTEYGDVVGRFSRLDGVSRFFGVRIAQTTAGANRYKNPIPPIPWTTPQQATTKTSCAQWSGNVPALSGTPGWQGSEDCLFISIVAPGQPNIPSLPTVAPNGTYPVQFWIYGGGFSSESFPFFNYKDSYYAGGDATNLAHLPANGKTVSVFVNYRVMYLGGLSHPALRGGISGQTASGNYHVMDVHEGLKWVSRNIGNFGGDPARVTIQGESAGATMTFMQVASPLNYPPNVPAPLVVGAIGQSLWPVAGNGVSFSQTIRDAAGDGLIAAIGCWPSYDSSTTASSLDLITIANCLRAADGVTTAQAIQSAQPDEASFDAVHGSGALGYINFQGIGWYPCVNGDSLTKAPSDHYRDGIASQVHIMVGQNANEDTLFIPSLYPVGSGGYMFEFGYFYAIWTSSLDITSTIAQVVAYSLSMNYSILESQNYYTAMVDDYQRQVAMADDGYFSAGLAHLLDIFAANPGRPANSLFRYIFAQPNTGPTDGYPAFGVPHTADLTYTWGYYEMGYNALTDNMFGMPGPFPIPADERAMGVSMKVHWANFFHTGNPTVAGDGATPFQAVTATEKHSMVYKAEIASGGAALDPCVAFISCLPEPTADFRRPAATMWLSSMATTPPAATCTGAVTVGYSRTSTATFADQCSVVVGSGVWTQYAGKNCYDGAGATSLGLLGYVQTVDACKTRCIASSGCSGITIYTASNWKACYSRTNIVISQCDTSSNFDTYTVSAGQIAAPGPGWTANVGKNCYSGKGATDLGLLGYFQSLDDCKNACNGRAGCEAVTVTSGSSSGYEACFARADVVIAQCGDSTLYDTHTNNAYMGSGKLAGTDPSTGQPFANVDRGVAYGNSTGTQEKAATDKTLPIVLGVLGSVAIITAGVVAVIRGKQAATAPKDAKVVEIQRAAAAANWA
jgi:carboxylesterase type B